MQTADCRLQIADQKKKKVGQSFSKVFETFNEATKYICSISVCSSARDGSGHVKVCFFTHFRKHLSKFGINNEKMAEEVNVDSYLF